MATVFWDKKGVLLVDFMEHRTAKKEVYWETLCRLQRATQIKRRDILSSGVVHIHDNTVSQCQYSDKTTVLQKFEQDVFDHSPYSPDSSK